MPQSRELKTLRAMSWERAKGELRAMLNTYWDEPDKFSAMDAELDKFIKQVEENGFHE